MLTRPLWVAFGLGFLLAALPLSAMAQDAPPSIPTAPSEPLDGETVPLPNPDYVPPATSTLDPPPAAREVPKPPEESPVASAPEEAPAAPRAAVEYKDLLVPKYQRQKPQWAAQVSGSLNALGSDSFFPIEDAGVSIQFEWQPAILQKFGVFGLGLNLNAYYLSPATGLPSSSWTFPFSIFSGGAQVRYQMRYFREQVVVPFGGYTAEYAYYRLANPESGTFLAHGPFVGGSLLLNIFEPSAAAEMFADTDISRTYLVTEVRFISGGDGAVTIPFGPSVYVGLRFEF